MGSFGNDCYNTFEIGLRLWFNQLLRKSKSIKEVQLGPTK